MPCPRRGCGDVELRELEIFLRRAKWLVCNGGKARQDTAVKRRQHRAAGKEDGAQLLQQVGIVGGGPVIEKGDVL